MKQVTTTNAITLYIDGFLLDRIGDDELLNSLNLKEKDNTLKEHKLPKIHIKEESIFYGLSIYKIGIGNVKSKIFNHITNKETVENILDYILKNKAQTIELITKKRIKNETTKNN